jgi:hypothetical protein
MSLPHQRPRPGLLTFIGIVSLIWSSMTLVGSVVAAFLLLIVGAGSWFLGPLAGAVGTLVVTLVVLWMAASSILSILLFNAGWKTLKDDPAGIRLHRLWAWISLALDVIALIGSGGTAPNSWTGVAYAIAVLYITSSPEVLSYYGFDPRVKPPKPGVWTDDLG